LLDSQYNLAVLYEQGLGVSEDAGEAAYWFEIAGRAGDSDAARRARELLAGLPSAEAEQIKRRARSFNPKPVIARANGEFGKRPWDAPSSAQIMEAQRLLERLGYTPGPADGKPGGRTAEAIRAFEKDKGLPLTGEANAALLRQLHAATLNGG
jgi:localization factor PodJL